MKHATWLMEQLPTLQRDGVLDAAAVERLRARYAEDALAGTAISGLLLASLGAVLVALGLILLAAHNWEGWGRGVRLAASFAPLAVSQLAVAWLLWRPAGRAAREAVAGFSVLAFALALAMVGQVFHFPGDLDRYLMTCAVLSLPLIYLLASSVAAALYGGAIVGAVLALPAAAGHPLLVAAAYALLLPLLHVRGQTGWAGGRPLLLMALVPMLFAAVLFSLPQVPRLGLWWLAVLGAALVLIDDRQHAATALWRRPLAVYGSVAVAVAALIGSFADIWRGWFWHLTPAQLPEAWLLLGAALGGVLWLAMAALRRGHLVAALHALPALSMALVAAIDTRSWALPLAWMHSAFVLLLGLGMLREGLQQQQWGTASRGLLLVTVLVLLRFLDADWSFTVRGVMFLLTGAAFISVSLWLRRRLQA